MDPSAAVSHTQAHKPARQSPSCPVPSQQEGTQPPSYLNHAELLVVRGLFLQGLQRLRGLCMRLLLRLQHPLQHQFVLHTHTPHLSSNPPFCSQLRLSHVRYLLQGTRGRFKLGRFATGHGRQDLIGDGTRHLLPPPSVTYEPTHSTTTTTHGPSSHSATYLSNHRGDLLGAGVVLLLHNRSQVLPFQLQVPHLHRHALERRRQHANLCIDNQTDTTKR